MARDFCSVADAQCQAPAGYRTGGGGGFDGKRKTPHTCHDCGQPVCAACSVGTGKERRCNHCADARPALKVNGVVVDGADETRRSVVVFFNRPLTDDELRAFHEALTKPDAMKLGEQRG